MSISVSNACGLTYGSGSPQVVTGSMTTITGALYIATTFAENTGYDSTPCSMNNYGVNIVWTLAKKLSQLQPSGYYTSVYAVYYGVCTSGSTGAWVASCPSSSIASEVSIDQVTGFNTVTPVVQTLSSTTTVDTANSIGFNPTRTSNSTLYTVWFSNSWTSGSASLTHPASGTTVYNSGNTWLTATNTGSLTSSTNISAGINSSTNDYMVVGIGLELMAPASIVNIGSGTFTVTNNNIAVNSIKNISVSGGSYAQLLQNTAVNLTQPISVSSIGYSYTPDNVTYKNNFNIFISGLSYSSSLSVTQVNELTSINISPVTYSVTVDTNTQINATTAIGVGSQYVYVNIPNTAVDAQLLLNIGAVNYTYTPSVISIQEVTVIGITPATFNVTPFQVYPNIINHIDINFTTIQVLPDNVQVNDTTAFAISDINYQTTINNANSNAYVHINIAPVNYGMTLYPMMRTTSFTTVNISPAVYHYTNDTVDINATHILGITPSVYSVIPDQVQLNAKHNLFTNSVNYSVTDFNVLVNAKTTINIGRSCRLWRLAR